MNEEQLEKMKSSPPSSNIVTLLIEFIRMWVDIEEYKKVRGRKMELDFAISRSQISFIIFLLGMIFIVHLIDLFI